MLFLFFLLGVIPKVLACPACYSASAEQLTAYYVTTGFLVLLPFLLIGFVGLILYKLVRHR